LLMPIVKYEEQLCLDLKLELQFCAKNKSHSDFVMCEGKAGEYQSIMKQIQMDIVPHPVCENQRRATRLGQYFNLDSSFTCAGGKPGKDTCTGIFKTLSHTGNPIHLQCIWDFA